MRRARPPLEILIRGDDHAHVHRDGMTAADPFDLALLQHPQQRDLCFGRQVADFVEQDGATVRRFESAQTSLQRAGKAPFSWPNSSDAMSEVGIAAQFTRMKARLARRERLWIARAISSLPVPVSRG